MSTPTSQIFMSKHKGAIKEEVSNQDFLERHAEALLPKDIEYADLIQMRERSSRYAGLLFHIAVLVIISIVALTLAAAVSFQHPAMEVVAAQKTATDNTPDAEILSISPEQEKFHPVSFIDPSHNYSMLSPCGRTAEEARARACHFELLSFSWVPDECHDHELVEDFKHIQIWQFWLHDNRTGLVTQEEAQTGEYDAVYAEWGYHLQHCAGMWKKMHRAFLGGGYTAVDSVMGNMWHTDHCSELLLMRDSNLDRLSTLTLRKFPDCGLIL